MEKLLINTPQNVQIEYHLASVGERILGIIIDFIIMIAYYALCIYILIKLDLINTTDNWWNLGIYSLFSLPVFLYPLLSEIFFNGQTIGKKALKIRVVKIDGTRATSYEYFVRWTLLIIDIWISLVFLFPGLIGLISIIVTKKFQRIGDIAADTAVISLKSKLNLNQTILEELKEEYQPIFPNVVLLSDTDVNIIKKMYNQAVKNKNNISLNDLSNKIMEVTKIERGNMSDTQFIDRILKDHFYYHHQEK